MILADKIINERKKNGWSQEELADMLNVSRQSVSKWEGAQSVSDLQKILKMAEIFSVSTDYLLKDELEPDGNNDAGAAKDGDGLSDPGPDNIVDINAAGSGNIADEADIKGIRLSNPVITSSYLADDRGTGDEFPEAELKQTPGLSRAQRISLNFRTE